MLLTHTSRCSRGIGRSGSSRARASRSSAEEFADQQIIRPLAAEEVLFYGAFDGDSALVRPVNRKCLT